MFKLFISLCHVLLFVKYGNGKTPEMCKGPKETILFIEEFCDPSNSFPCLRSCAGSKITNILAKHNEDTLPNDIPLETKNNYGEVTQEECILLNFENENEEEVDFVLVYQSANEMVLSLNNVKIPKTEECFDTFFYSVPSELKKTQISILLKKDVKVRLIAVLKKGTHYPTLYRSLDGTQPPNRLFVDPTTPKTTSKDKNFHDRLSILALVSAVIAILYMLFLWVVVCLLP